MILLFGDFGSRKSFNQMEELLNILKVLITEKKYVRDLSDKTDDGNYDNKKLTLKCDSIGGVYSSVINDFTNGDSQLESRTISSTPYGAKEKRHHGLHDITRVQRLNRKQRKARNRKRA